MKLRTQIILWITALFAIGFIASTIIQDTLTRQDLRRITKKIAAETAMMANARREHLETYLHSQIDKIRTKIFVEASFMSTSFQAWPMSLLQATPYLFSASWLLQNRWDSVVGVDGHVIVTMPTFTMVDMYEAASGLFIATQGQARWIAIPLTMEETIPEKFYLLFDEKELVALPRNASISLARLVLDPLHPYPVLEIIQDTDIIARIQQVQEVLAQSKPQEVKRPITPLKQFRSDAEKGVQWQYDQANMIWSLAAFQLQMNGIKPAGLVKTDPFGIRAVVTDSTFFAQNPFAFTKTGEDKVQIFTSPDFQRFFFGLHFLHGNHLFTIGVDGSQFLGDLARALQQVIVLLYRGTIIAVFNENGARVSPISWQDVDLQTILTKPVGFIDVGGESRSYLRTDPLANTDLHIIASISKDKALAITKTMYQQAQSLIARLSLQMRLVAFVISGLVLIFLLHLTRKITKPVSLLSQATEQISHGHFGDVHLPILGGKRAKDEVYTLYKGFQAMVEGLKEKEKVRGILNKVVDPEIAKEIVDHGLQLGGEEREATILFADIRNFTKTTEQMEPKEVITLLNQCMTRVAKMVDKSGGVIDKFVGDEVMALFGIPLEKPQSCLHAVECAWLIIQSIKEWNLQRKGQGYPEILMGIGIHKGVVVAGNMGAENRLNYTVVGSNVNLAARLCAAAGEMEILISDGVMQDIMVKEKIYADLSPIHQLKGFSGHLAVYSVKSVDGVS